MTRLLHLAPHPDDELLGAPATMLAFKDAGWTVHNLPVSLGRPDDHDRRRAELQRACELAGFELLDHEHLPISSGDDLAAAEQTLTRTLAGLVAGYDIVMGPSPHDRHHGHEVVARAAKRALEEVGEGRLWLWGLWGELVLPTVVCAYDQERHEFIDTALSAHAGEMARNNYRQLLLARGLAGRILGPERVFGFRAGNRITEPYAELVSEVVLTGGQWRLGQPQYLDATAALLPPTTVDASFWLDAESVTTALRRQH